MNCRVCEGEMKPGLAMQNGLQAGIPDFPGDKGYQRGQTMSYTGPPRLVSVLKCEGCGRSVANPQTLPIIP